MCDMGNECDHHSATATNVGERMGRRGLIAGSAALAGAWALGDLAPAQAAGRVRGRESHFEVVLLGTQPGPQIQQGRAGVASAVVVDGAVYLVDCGYGSLNQLVKAQLGLSDLRGVFITHLHADHFVDYFNFFALGFSSAPGAGVPDHLPAYGPGPAGALPPASDGREVPPTSPANPTPGLIDTTESFHDAFAYSTNIFRRFTPAVRDTRDLVTPNEIALPDVGASALGETAPDMEPFLVMEDDRVRVTATLVAHPPVFPAFGYRFDTDYGSVTFSGDTGASQNVVKLARNSDVLVHEAMSIPPGGGPPGVDLLSYHTSVDEVGDVARQADVPHLALSHIVDLADPNRIPVGDWTRRIRNDYDGRLTIGRDLDRLRIY